MAELRFDAAANAIYHFPWDRFCDWYLELIKPVFQGDRDTPAAQETREVAGWALDQILVMLHPFMPFITEELWHAQAEYQGGGAPLRTDPGEVAAARSKRRCRSDRC